MASLVGNKYFLLWKWSVSRTKEFLSSILNLPFCFLSRYFACKCIFTVNCCLIMIKNYSCNPGIPSMNPGPKMSDSPGSRGRDSPGLSSLGRTNFYGPKIIRRKISKKILFYVTTTSPESWKTHLRKNSWYNLAKPGTGVVSSIIIQSYKK